MRPRHDQVAAYLFTKYPDEQWNYFSAQTTVNNDKESNYVDFQTAMMAVILIGNWRLNPSIQPHDLQELANWS